MDKSGNQVRFLCSAGAARAQKCAEKTEVCTVLLHIYAKPYSSMIIIIIDDYDELVMFSPFSLNNFEIYIFIYFIVYIYYFKILISFKQTKENFDLTF